MKIQMAKTKKILKQMMIFSFSAILIMGTGISVSADSSVEENIPDDMIQQIEQCQEETDFFSSNSEAVAVPTAMMITTIAVITITAVIITTIVAIAIITMAMTLTVIIKMTIRMVTVTPVLI